MLARPQHPAGAEPPPLWLGRRIQHQKQRPAGRPWDDHRNTNSHQPPTNSRTVRSGTRTDANDRPPKTSVHDHPSGFGREQSVVLCQRPAPARLVCLLLRVPVPWLDVRPRLRGALQLLTPSAVLLEL